MARAGIELNGVRYRWPSRPVVVVCIDGGDPAYFDRGVRDGVVPNVARFMKTGFAAVADGDVPSFTCPNNMSITTGSPPAVHGISGNFYLNRETGEAVGMTGPDLPRSRTIMAEVSRHGATRSEEHTSELQSRLHLVCRLLLGKKKTTRTSLPTQN